MRIIAAIAVVGLIAALAQHASAGMKEDCLQSDDPDLTIGGCTAVIQSGMFADNPGNLAITYNNRAWALYLMGRNAEALADVDRALVDLPDDAAIIDTRTHVLAALGRSPEALAEFGSDMAYGQSPALLEAYIRYNTLYNQGRYSEAIRYATEALRLGEEELGPDHPFTATLMNNLASLYRAQGNYAEAAPLYRRSLAIREKALGPKHPDVATSLNNLAGLYKTQGNYAEAEPMYQRSLAIMERVLGPEHPDVATSLNNLAVLYLTQGNYAEAAPLYRRSLAIMDKALGPEHPNVATSLENYAALLRETGRADEAAEMEARAKAIRAKYE